jgi:hypothetical protein
MRFRSGYARDARWGGGTGRRIWIRRAQCRRCRVSHALLPSFLLERRLDVVDDIGAVVETVLDGVAVVARAAASAGVPYTTARDWLRRFSSRAARLAAGFAALAVEAEAEVGVATLAVDAERRVLGALRLVAHTLGASSVSLWALASLITGGELLASATDPPWRILGGRRFMPPSP